MYMYMHMKIQKGLSNPNLGEAIPLPSQAHLYNIPVQKAEPLRCLGLRTRTGVLCLEGGGARR